MSAEQVTTTRASTRDGLTLADLVQFVQAADNNGADPRQTVKVRAGFRGQVLAITTGKATP